MKVKTTKNFWWNFKLEYDRGDMGWAFSRIKVSMKGNKAELDIDNSFVCDDDNNRGNTALDWFKMIMRTDIDPCGWILDNYDEQDKSEKAKRRHYIAGCKKILLQL